MSMKPGATTQPVASSSLAPRRFGPISRITPSAIATSAARPGAPLPSKTVPPRITSSADIWTSARVAEPPNALRQPVTERQVLDASVDRRAQALHRPRHLERVQAGEQVAEDRLELDGRDVRAHPEVPADAEGRVAVR